MTRIGILLSGRGSNFLALHGAMERHEVPGEVGLVVSNVPDAVGLEKARALRLPAVSIPHRSEPSRVAHEAKVLEALKRAEVEWLCLAGYMRKLSDSFVSQFPQRILNIHPSLLPAFPGLEAQRQAWDYGVKVSGCTVHLVEEELDAGPIVAQRSVPVHEDDSPESLAARILVEEHKLYPEALRRVLTERWKVEGRRVRFLGKRVTGGG
jgi:phosphoribosylglycinamide formyltransferase-1